MHTNNIAITLENFQQIVIDESKKRLVLVDFWAEQIPESVTMRDQFASKCANAAETLLFATVDCQTQQQIAAQFGLQGLPTAILVKDGQPIDGISGPQPEAAVDEFLAKYLPKPEDDLLASAKQLLIDNDASAAYTLALQAYQLDNTRADIKLTLADSCVSLGKTEDAQALIDSIKMVDQDSYYHAVVAKLALAISAGDSPEIQALEIELAADERNPELIQKLATQYHQAKRNEDALTLLFRQVQSVKDDSDSKKLLLDIMKALPNGDPLAATFRRKLYTLMY